MRNRRPLRTEAEQFAGVCHGKLSLALVTDRYMTQEAGRADSSFAVINEYQVEGIGAALIHHIAGIAMGRASCQLAPP